MPSLKESKYAFKLKSGSHLDRGTDQVVEPGGTFYTDVDMAKLEGRNRWELIKGEEKETLEDLKARIKELEGKLPSSETPQATTADELESKSIKELRIIAAEMVPPVDLSTCTGKTEIVNAIRQALDAA